MNKKVLRGIFAAFAATAVCVPLAACSGTTDTQTQTTVSEASVSETTASETGTELEETTSDVTTTSEEGTEASSEAGTASSQEQTASSGEINGATPVDNGSVASETLKVDVTGYQVYPAGIGGAANSLDPVVVFYYDVTNLSDKEITALDAWTEVFEAYQNTSEDDANKLGQGIFVDESIPSQQGTTPLKKDETASYYKSYQLTDDTTSVTLRSHDGLGGASLGEDITVRIMS